MAVLVGCLTGLTLAAVSAVKMGVLGSHLGDFGADDGGTVALVGVPGVVVVVFLLSVLEIDGFFWDGGLLMGIETRDVTHIGDHGPRPWLVVHLTRAPMQERYCVPIIMP